LEEVEGIAPPSTRGSSILAGQLACCVPTILLEPEMGFHDADVLSSSSLVFSYPFLTVMMPPVVGMGSLLRVCVWPNFSRSEFVDLNLLHSLKEPG
jgi:hypothetical protein